MEREVIQVTRGGINRIWWLSTSISYKAYERKRLMCQTTWNTQHLWRLSCKEVQSSLPLKLTIMLKRDYMYVNLYICGRSLLIVLFNSTHISHCGWSLNYLMFDTNCIPECWMHLALLLQQHKTHLKHDWSLLSEIHSSAANLFSGIPHSSYHFCIFPFRNSRICVCM